MIIIDDKIVSDDVVEQHFLCNLKACKGACCWEGDYGAPLEAEEVTTLQRIYPIVKPFLQEEGIAVIETEGVYTKYKKEGQTEETDGTPLLHNGACAYMIYDELGIAQCGIEQAHQAGKTDFKKPISCHLYPVRVTAYDGFEALNYDEWEICSPACSLGQATQLPLFHFVREALIRKYGEAFYKELEAAATHLNKD